MRLDQPVRMFGHWCSHIISALYFCPWKIGFFKNGTVGKKGRIDGRKHADIFFRVMQSFLSIYSHKYEGDIWKFQAQMKSWCCACFYSPPILDSILIQNSLQIK